MPTRPNRILAKDRLRTYTLEVGEEEFNQMSKVIRYKRRG